MINKDEVLTCAKDQIVSSGTVPQGGQDIVTFNLYLSFPHLFTPTKVKTFMQSNFNNTESHWCIKSLYLLVN